eukprot:804162-Pelagomonas_calceolata.AAC.4
MNAFARLHVHACTARVVTAAEGLRSDALRGRLVVYSLTMSCMLLSHAWQLHAHAVVQAGFAAVRECLLALVLL